MTSGIYKIVNLTDGKIYIGSAVNLNRRFIVHRWQLSKNIHSNIRLQNAYNKYGADTFEFIAIEYCKLDKLIEREQYWMDNLFPDYNLCQIAGSPNLGKNITKAHKRKISQSLIGLKRSPESRAKMSAWQIGQKMSDEAKRNMTLAKQGNQSRRLKTKWPHADGCECKCNECRQKRKDIKKAWDLANYIHKRKPLNLAGMEQINV